MVEKNAGVPAMAAARIAAAQRMALARKRDWLIQDAIGMRLAGQLKTKNLEAVS
jgi:hypothetical protein